MKRINVLFLMAFLIVGTLGFVVAEDSLGEADIPEAKKIGFFENMFDNVGLAFTFNKEKKIARALELAEKRLAEAEALVEESPEEAERAQERYNDFIAKAEKVLEKISDAKAENENLSIDEMEKMARIQNQFERHREQTAKIYTRALERFEKNNASDEKIERFENFYDRALNRSDKMEEKILQKREAAIKRHKVLAEKSDEEIESILEEIEEREGLTEAREQRVERAEVRVQKFAVMKQKNVERIQARLNETDLTEAQREQITNRVEIATQRAQEFEIQTRERIEAYKDVGISVLESSTEKLMESDALNSVVS